ncbi:MAG: phosphoglycerate dehydrogenase [Anaerovoracaceae bacterium]|nr:phosphoglycerate dehydrogenase [Anaerovoracaceae bacterium]
MYKIATLNKISPVGLNRFGEDYTLVDDAAEADAIVVRSQNMHDMKFGSGLRAIARAGAGVNNIPLQRCAEEGIVVFNAPGANANAVKELVLAGLLLASRNIPEALTWTKTLKKDVGPAVEAGKKQFAGHELKGKTLGVIGLGAIGVMVANLCLSLDMNVVGYDPYLDLRHAHALSGKIPVINDLQNMLPKCDFITIHVPMNDSTRGMIDERRFGQMKKGAVFLNFARDGLVNEKALVEALDEGHLGKYVTDFPTDAIINHRNVIHTPHLGASTTEAEENCAIMAAEEIIDFFEHGNIENSVNFPACDLGVIHPDAAARLCIMNKNVPTILSQFTQILSDRQINIRDLTNKSRKEFAYNILDVDKDIPDDLLAKINEIDGVIKAWTIKNK